jgi:hypothetical protein
LTPDDRADLRGALLRNSFRYASTKDWSQIAKDLKPDYTAPSEQAAPDRFAEFSEKWKTRYPAIVRLWTNACAEFVPFPQFDVEIRAIICTTDEIVKPPPAVWLVFRRPGWWIVWRRPRQGSGLAALGDFSRFPSARANA